MTRGHQTDLRPEVAVEVAVEATEDLSGAGAEAEAAVVVAEALSKAPHSVGAAVDEAEDVEAVAEEAGVGGEGGRVFQLIIK
jgi:hypothetical protein